MKNILKLFYNSLPWKKHVESIIFFNKYCIESRNHKFKVSQHSLKQDSQTQFHVIVQHIPKLILLL